jgi:hypothetical protein
MNEDLHLLYILRTYTDEGLLLEAERNSSSSLTAASSGDLPSSMRLGNDERGIKSKNGRTPNTCR